jgi:hypothetical protein
MPLPAAAPPRTTQPYPAGVAGVKLSIGEMARLMRAARIGPDSDQLRGLAGRAFIAAGRPQTIREQLQVLLDTVRARTVYMPDPVAAEYVVAPAGTLCVRPGLCVPAGDCDDLTTALGALCLVSGINVRIVKQTFGSGDQEHVLIEAQDENGEWIPADPSSDWPVGRKAMASSEVTIEPMDDQQVGMLTNMENNFVGVGGLPRSRFLAARQGLGRITRGSWGVGDAAAVSVAPVAAPGSGWFGYTFVTPDVVQQVKDRLNANVVALDTAYTQCASATPADKAGWQAFSDVWHNYYANPPGWFMKWWGLPSQMAVVESYETDIQSWQQKAQSSNCYSGIILSTDAAENQAATHTAEVVRSIAVSIAIVGGTYALYKGVQYVAAVTPKKSSKKEE